MKIYTNYLNSKWARLGLLTMALSSTLSITPSQSLMEQKIFASSEGTHQAPNTDTKEAAAKISGQLKALNGNDSFSNEVVEVIRMEIPTDNGKLKVTLEKSEKTGQILAIIPWNQTEGSVCIDNTCSDRKSFQIETRFSDFKGNESDIQVQILKEIKKAKAKSSEAKEEKQKEEVKIDSSIRENILPPKKTDLTEGGKLLAQAVKSCDEDVKCLHTEFLDILKGDKRPSVAEALNFYTNYLEEKIINLLTKETKESLFSLYFGTRDKGLKIIRDLLAKIPSGFLPLREAIV
nr:hypothetical protein [Pseudobdellovibrionaceae bacterium]